LMVDQSLFSIRIKKTLGATVGLPLLEPLLLELLLACPLLVLEPAVPLLLVLAPPAPPVLAPPLPVLAVLPLLELVAPPAPPLFLALPHAVRSATPASSAVDRKFIMAGTLHESRGGMTTSPSRGRVSAPGGLGRS
jgi:hypothetical protein